MIIQLVLMERYIFSCQIFFFQNRMKHVVLGHHPAFILQGRKASYCNAGRSDDVSLLYCLKCLEWDMNVFYIYPSVIDKLDLSLANRLIFVSTENLFQHHARFVVDLLNPTPIACFQLSFWCFRMSDYLRFIMVTFITCQVCVDGAESIQVHIHFMFMPRQLCKIPFVQLQCRTHLLRDVRYCLALANHVW